MIEVFQSLQVVTHYLHNLYSLSHLELMFVISMKDSIVKISKLAYNTLQNKSYAYITMQTNQELIRGHHRNRQLTTANPNWIQRA